jgi:hypothetical protein
MREGNSLSEYGLAGLALEAEGEFHILGGLLVELSLLCDFGGGLNEDVAPALDIELEVVVVGAVAVVALPENVLGVLDHHAPQRDVLVPVEAAAGGARPPADLRVVRGKTREVLVVLPVGLELVLFYVVVNRRGQHEVVLLQDQLVARAELLAPQHVYQETLK